MTHHERELMLFLADQVERLLLASHDPYERQIRQQLDKLRKPLLDASRDEAEVRRLIGLPEPCCGKPDDCTRECWQRR